MKPGQHVNLYLLAGPEHSGLRSELAAVGLEAHTLPDKEAVVLPAVLALAAGQKAPDAFEGVSVAVPPGVSRGHLRELVALAMENASHRLQISELEHEVSRRHRQFRDLNRIGIALSAEKDIEKLQQLILLKLRELTNADGASLWLKTDSDDELYLASSQNHSLDKNTYSDFKVPVDQKTVVGYVVSTGEALIYDDAYTPPAGKPKGGKGFDSQFGYHTKSMLTVPMRNYKDEVRNNEDEIVGAVQLINAKRRFETRLTDANVDAEVVGFRHEDVEMIESIASQAAVALDNKTLLDLMQAQFDGFVQASVTAIEQRDPTTAGHSGRVEALTSRLAKVVNGIDVGRFRDVYMTEDQLKELRYACLLHDFGKVGVREHVLRKAKKLPVRQLDVIQARFEAIKRSRQVQMLSDKIDALSNGHHDPATLAAIDGRLMDELARLGEWMLAIETANEPTVTPEDKAAGLEALSQEMYTELSGVARPVLEPLEFRFLSILKGTLDPQERLEIESHVSYSFDFLSKIPWTPVMKNIPEIAWGHHEKLDGSGYPRKLRGDQIHLQSRMMTISDIYDALTAQDRPYKPKVSTPRALDILHDEAAEGKLDRDLLDIFVQHKVYEAAAVR